MASEIGFVQQLLSAEKAAQEKVALARKRRTVRIHDAQEEAKAEIAKIEAEMLQKFKDYEIQCKESNIAIGKQIVADTSKFIGAMVSGAATNKQAIINEMIELTYDISPELHRNYMNADYIF